MNDSTRTNPFPPDLKIQYWRLRAMAQLIGNQRNEEPPLDIEEVNYGIGEILNDIAKGIFEFIETLEPSQDKENETCLDSENS